MNLTSINEQLYQVQQWANQWVGYQLEHLTLISVGVVLIAGLATSLTPCMLSMLPLTVAYIGGYQSQSRTVAFFQSLYFAFGLATTLAILGVFSAVFGKIYGQIGIGLPIFVSVIAILMGLNLLELIPLQFPSWGGTDWIKDNFPAPLRSYLLGVTFGLVASPCSTPVLITLLAYIANSQQVIFGSVLLLSYAVGYVLPLVIAGTFTGALSRLLSLRVITQWLNPGLGALLLAFGVISLASRF